MTKFVTSLGKRFHNPDWIKRARVELDTINEDYLLAQAKKVVSTHPEVGDELAKIAQVIRRVKFALEDRS